jgi:hypothetical protein
MHRVPSRCRCKRFSRGCAARTAVDVGSPLVLGAVIAVQPLPILAFILVLGTDHGARKGAAFHRRMDRLSSHRRCRHARVHGRVTAETVNRSCCRRARGHAPLRRRLGRHACFRHFRHTDAAPSEPSWMTRLDDLHSTGAAILGVLTQPWPLIAAGVALVMEADVSKSASVSALVLFGVIATSALATMEIYSLAAPTAAASRLHALHSWLNEHRTQAITVVSAVLGTYLVIKSLIGLVKQS